MFDTYNVTYVTMRGAGGSNRVPQHELHTWLAAHPSRLIVRLEPIYTTLEESQQFKDAEDAGKKNYALSILRSV